MKSIKQIKKKKTLLEQMHREKVLYQEVYQKNIILMLQSVDKKKHERNKEQKLRVLDF